MKETTASTSITPVAPLLYSRSETAQALGLCERSVDILIKSGRLASVKIGKRILCPVSAVQDMAANGTADPIKPRSS